MEFEIDNEVLQENKPTGLLQKAITILEELPDGKLLTTPSLKDKVGCGISSIYSNGSQYLNDYKVKYKKSNLWGNKNTIESFKEKYGGL